MDGALYIDERWVAAGDRSSLPLIDPSSETEIGRVPIATEDDLDSALRSAAKGLQEWRRFAPVKRAEALARSAALLRERREEIARTITIEQGKVIAEALGEVDTSAAILDWFGGEAMRLYGHVVPPPREDLELRVTLEPIGPVAIFTPWNFPLVEPVAHTAAALAAGCSTIIKVAEETPCTGISLIKILLEGGVHPNAVNLVTGDPGRISAHLIASPVIRKVALTGSTEVGRKLASLCGQHLKPSTMELGGNAPVIVTENVDVTEVAKMLATRKNRNAGQVCTAPNRFFIQRAIFDDFTQAYSNHMQSFPLGSGLDQQVSTGPLAHNRRLGAMSDFINDARTKGAGIEIVGQPAPTKGYYFAHALALEAPSIARVATHEIFGPISAFWKFDDIPQAIERANATSAGLAGYVFDRDGDRASSIAERLEVGTVAVNQGVVMFVEAPFGGIKDSGFGRILGREGASPYTTAKLTSYHRTRSYGT
ncbi:aldehyde dehydrogenase family protein [Bradyrhizobium sp. STM 3562]|uniref:aldehyde dehydrogenase family protein n=1 Tax=Bradyrhizobium sp. STM 3562 TaxID=578924 RepID=UPI00388E7ADA